MSSGATSRTGDPKVDLRSEMGMVLLQKPSGVTSFAALGQLKRVVGTRRIGHTGTLDRFASGLLIALVGRLTRIGWLITDLPKRYLATIYLGRQTTTLDPEGPIEFCRPLPSRQDLQEVLPRFIGHIRQVPPAYSAVHIDGIRASKRARRGEEVKPGEREVFVDSIKIVSVDFPRVTIEVACGKGTYVRSLARDLSLAAGSCGHLIQLQRLSIGDFTVDDAVPIDQADISDVMPPLEFLHRIDGLEVLQVTTEGARRIRDGYPVVPSFLQGEPSDKKHTALLGGKELLAILEPVEFQGDCIRSTRPYRYRCVLASRA